MIDSWPAAEQACVDWLRQFHPDARRTRGGADGGVDIVATGLIAQVKFEAAQVGRPVLQKLAGARGRDTALSMLFFTGAGYAAPAVEYAEMMDIALFKYDLVGRMTPQNRAAVGYLARQRSNNPTDDDGSSAPAHTAPASEARAADLLMHPAARWLRRWGPLLVVGWGLINVLRSTVLLIEIISGTADPAAGETVGEAALGFVFGAIAVLAGHFWSRSRVRRGRKRWG